MAYDISYFDDRAMRHLQPDADRLPDAALDRYPAPTGRETAYARHSSDRSLDRYGYDGGWHVRPTAAAVAADRADAAPYHSEDWEE